MFWFDWAHAVSITGHDIEIKQTYVSLITSNERPALFLDIGANHGSHSVLFLSAGIPAIAFEPNPNCQDYFRTLCELNGLPSARWEQVALGNSDGIIELVYPETETWLGSVSSDVGRSLKQHWPVVTKQVRLRKLDDYLDQIPTDRALIKIDVEGFEYEVIRGGALILRERRPKVIFESNDDALRGELFGLFDQAGYLVRAIPTQQHLSLSEFVASPAANFIAVPRCSAQPCP